jgi:uncharacterized protein (TIGR04255 family)
MSATAIHFDKAPIVEAIVGIDFEEMLPVEALEALKGLGEKLATDYPTVENLMLGEYKIQFGHPVTQVDTQIGYFLKSADGLQVVHAKRNGFAFSRLKPYRTWEDFIVEAKRTWTLYRSIFGAAGLAKFSVRYINRLSWPNGENIENYLAVYPYIPDGLPQSINGCFLRLEFPLSEPHEGKLIQQIASVPKTRPDLVSFVLDNEFTFAAIGLQDAEVWQRIENCQKLKNEIFLSSITEKMKELIS